MQHKCDMGLGISLVRPNHIPRHPNVGTHQPRDFGTLQSWRMGAFHQFIWTLTNQIAVCEGEGYTKRGLSDPAPSGST